MQPPDDFALPNLIGSGALGNGQGPGLGQYDLGERAGSEYVTLSATSMPAHTHAAMGAPVLGDRNSPAGATWAQAGLGRVLDRNYGTAPDSTTMHPGALTPAVGGQPHNNLPPVAMRAG